MGETPPFSEQRRELAGYLRTQRERLAPAAVGIAAGNRRRTPGLRREELAQLSGISVTWYTWIEQARDVSISPAALARLAHALRLGQAERAYLFALAGKGDPEHSGAAADDVPPAILACVEAIACPAYVLDRLWNARCWNAPAQHLFVGWLDQPDDRNLLRFIFLEPTARSLIRDWDERARRVVAEFRAHFGAHREDRGLRGMIETLRRQSHEFAGFWDQHGVLGREGGERTFNHPRDGFLRYEQVTFNLATQPDFKLTMLLEQVETTAI
ncbi:MAG TPA: helix-turn-helix transcriptional regulator [Stellaceae bacterium]|jgi:transcriptional regulator with XRE-family HTH domain|nr:helix-turn-helix transcriptional regulator [Stellaceae bacterium]